jgi:hypothetical protein
MQAKPETFPSNPVETPAPKDEDLTRKNRFEEGASETSGEEAGFCGALQIAVGTADTKNPGKILFRKGPDEIRVRLPTISVQDNRPITIGSLLNLEIEVLSASSMAAWFSPEHYKLRHATFLSCLQRSEASPRPGINARATPETKKPAEAGSKSKFVFGAPFRGLFV